MMSYIADPTVIQHGLFLSECGVSAGKVYEAMDHHFRSRLRVRGQIRQDIRRFVTEALFIAYTVNTSRFLQ